MERCNWIDLMQSVNGLLYRTYGGIIDFNNEKGLLQLTGRHLRRD